LQCLSKQTRQLVFRYGSNSMPTTRYFETRQMSTLKNNTCHQVGRPARDEGEDVNHAHPERDVLGLDATPVVTHRPVASQQVLPLLCATTRVKRRVSALKFVCMTYDICGYADRY
jgi:hypothetical protein